MQESLTFLPKNPHISFRFVFTCVLLLIPINSVYYVTMFIYILCYYTIRQVNTIFVIHQNDRYHVGILSLNVNVNEYF